MSMQIHCWSFCQNCIVHLSCWLYKEELQYHQPPPWISNVTDASDYVFRDDDDDGDDDDDDDDDDD